MCGYVEVQRWLLWKVQGIEGVCKYTIRPQNIGILLGKLWGVHFQSIRVVSEGPWLWEVNIHPLYASTKQNGRAYKSHHDGDGKDYVSCSKSPQIVMDRNGGHCGYIWNRCMMRALDSIMPKKPTSQRGITHVRVFGYDAYICTRWNEG